MLRIAGNGLPRQCEHWLAMTGKILHSAPKIGALCNENRVIAREQRDRGNPFSKTGITDCHAPLGLAMTLGAKQNTTILHFAFLILHFGR